jgi:hypothetical protein
MPLADVTVKTVNESTNVAVVVPHMYASIEFFASTIRLLVVLGHSVA